MRCLFTLCHEISAERCAAFADRRPQLAPGIWLGDCHPNGTSAHGWTPGSLRSFLGFIDSVGITRIGVWCTATMPCPTVEENCPWMYTALRAWKARPVLARATRAG